jgi:UDP-glucose 4-epimerase
MKILVTGAAGFIGRHLLPALAAAGHDPYGLARPDQVDDLHGGVAVVCDLGVPIRADSLPRVEAVVHLAQANVAFPEEARLLYRVNTVSTQELLDLGRKTGIARFLFTSSGSVYGFGDRRLTEDDELAATDFYAATKIHAERLVSHYREFFASTIFRLFMPYGPGQRGRLIPALIGRIERGEPVTLNGGGQPRSNPIYVDDVVRAVLAALRHEGHKIVNVAGDEDAGIGELSERIGAAIGKEPRFQDGSPDGPGDLLADNRRLHELVPGDLVSLDEGLKNTVDAQMSAGARTR